MNTHPPLRILASTNNTRGDLFTRLVADLFFALGYDDLRFDVHKSGREIDIQGTHRHEPRRLVAECKAHVDKIGGRDLNTLMGALTRERSNHDQIPVAGYFVSLSGFRETAVQQERDTDSNTRLTLLDADQVVQELVKCRVLVDDLSAAEQAGRCAQHAGLDDAQRDAIQLLGHERGYFWAVFYSQNKQPTHFALIHADGTPLAQSVASEIIQADTDCHGSLDELQYLPPPSPLPDRQALARSAVDCYRRWIVTECGHIQLEGLPADAHLSAFRMNLERLFVPLKVVFNPPQPHQVQPDRVREKPPQDQESIAPVGEFLARHSRFSLLAKPGGGKSTLLKRLAVAYAQSDRLDATDDGLPKRDWLPLFLRCRELQDRARRPIRELLGDLAQHTGMNGDEGGAFREQIDEALRSGRALLLVDGLDEISVTGDRTTFAQHLRTFLAMFPKTAMVITSREAGYRDVVGVLAGACHQATLAPFDQSDVQRLCLTWHLEVEGHTKKVRSDAAKLAQTIWDNQRIRPLAENPLMLTTLMVVRRCRGGELPTRRVELYAAAVEVLIRTWNTEGFQPMDLDETLAQLSYVATSMMNQGISRVGHRQLLKLLHQARAEMQAELQFTKISPAEFIQRIEYRSSILMQTGHERIDDELQPVYEFRHLTFQEYLTARGLVEEQYPGRDEAQAQDLSELLEPHFNDQKWQEVIPLAAVLAGRKAEPLVKRLTSLCEEQSCHIVYPQASSVVLLRHCLLDEVRVTPATLQAALRQMARQMARHLAESFAKGSVVTLLRGKFGDVFRQVTDEAYLGMGPGWEEYYAAVSNLASEAVFQNRSVQLTDDVAESLVRGLTSADRVERAYAALVCRSLVHSYREVAGEDSDSPTEQFQPLRNAVGRLLSPADPPLAMAAAGALGWMGNRRLPSTPPEPAVIRALFRLWREADSSKLRRFAAWAFSTQPLLPRDTFVPEVWGDCGACLEEEASKDHWRETVARFVLAWYRRTPCTDSELAEKLSKAPGWVPRHPTARDILATLGEPGRRVLEKWDAKKKKP